MRLWFLLLAAAVFATHGYGAPNAEKLMTEAENIRSPEDSYAVKVLLEDHNKGKVDKHLYETFVKDRDRARVNFLEPAVDIGTKVLMDKNDMWVYLPSTAKPTRISARQKVAGNAAYGDVTRLNFTGNYAAKFLREDTFEGHKAYVLELTAIDGKPVTYDRIEYWVDQKTKRPLRTIYQTIGGKTIREGTYADYENVLGVQRPTKFIIADAIDKSHITILKFKGAKQQKFPDLLFQKQNLGRD